MTTIIDATSGTVDDLDDALARKHDELLKCIAINEALQDRMAAEAVRYEKQIAAMENIIDAISFRPVDSAQRPIGKAPRHNQAVKLLVLARYDKPTGDDDNLIWWADTMTDGSYVKAGVIGWRPLE